MHPRRSCSCTDCVYKPKSTSLQDQINNGSRIDRLYYGKYIPLREKKLIDKLVRTRAVYDDIRNELLSGSSTDLQKDDKNIKLDDDNESRSSAIYKIVNLVDKGDIPPLNSSVNLHSKCCTCCICRSKIHLPEHPKVHKHIPSLDHVHQYLEQHKGKINKGYKGVHFRTIQSEPCICTLEFRNINNKPNVVIKGFHSNERIQNVHHKVHEKHKNVRKKEVKIKPAAAVLNDCECVIENTKFKTRKSIEKFKKVAGQLRGSIRSSVTKIEHVFRIKKDSLVLFREKLRKNREMKRWTCEPNYCTPHECVPMECYNRIKKKRESHALIRPITKSTGSITNISTKEKRAKEKYRPRKQRESDYLLKSSQAAYELNRCFCTLQLQKRPKRKSYPPTPPPTPVTVSSKTSQTRKPIKDKTIMCECDHKENFECECEVKKKYTATQTTKIEYKNLKLLPYECEPSFCIPGLCDPLVCEERIKIRNLKNTDSFSKYANTAQIPGKTKMTSMSVTKSPPRAVQTRMPKHRKRPFKAEQLEVPYTNKSRSFPIAPTRQVVRIGSSFRFDVEFFKEKNFPEKGEDVYSDKNYGERPKPYQKVRSSETNTVTESISETIRNRDRVRHDLPRKISRKINKHTHYDNPPMEPFLKRCLCTLKFQKRPRQKPKARKFSPSKETMTKPNRNELYSRSKAAMTNTVVNYVIPPQYPRKLLPYECEPNFCIPGQCDPYICEKRIRTRNKTQSRETNTMYMPKKSTTTITSKTAAVYSDRKIQVGKQISGKSLTRTENLNEPYEEKSTTPANAPARQAVRIGSSFRFEIEFSKTRLDQPDVAASEKQIKVKPHTLKQTGNKKSHKQKVKERKVGGDMPQYNKKHTQSFKNMKSVPISTESLLKRCFCTLKFSKKPKRKDKPTVPKRIKTSYSGNDRPVATQTRKSSSTSIEYVAPPITTMPNLLPYECERYFCIKDQCNPIVCDERIRQRNKESGDWSLLKRCFCTLKFHNPGVLKGEKGAVIPLYNKFDRAPIRSRSIGTGPMKEKRRRNNVKLLPSECEPGVCVPDYCDPYECLKMINRRNMPNNAYHTKYVNTDVPKYKSTFSRPSKYFSRSQKSQSSLATKYDKAKKEKKGRKEEKSKRKEIDMAPSSPNKSRQSVKLSSKVSFNVEFFKNKSAPTEKVKSYDYDSNSKQEKRYNKQGEKLTKNHGVNPAGSYHNQISQAHNETADKYALAESKLERCFCTLKLHKKRKH